MNKMPVSQEDYNMFIETGTWSPDQFEIIPDGDEGVLDLNEDNRLFEEMMALYDRETELNEGERNRLLWITNYFDSQIGKSETVETSLLDELLNLANRFETLNEGEKARLDELSNIFDQ